METFASTDVNLAAFDSIAYINTPRWRSSVYGLQRIQELLEKLGRPQDRLKFVHVAGTNGKGSTCTYIASVLQQAGYKTGLFTSPYIMRFEERIQVNGQLISPDDLLQVTLAVRDIAEAMDDHPTEFELMCAVAFAYFAQQECDIVVCEVGLGGRLDATNVIERPEVSVIVRLGFDHTELLGDTLAAIAGEKAGIIKPGCPVITYPQEPEALAVIQAAAQEAGSELTVVDFSTLASERLSLTADDVVRRFSFGGEQFETRLLGAYQPQNAAVALMAIDALQLAGWYITWENVRDGIAAATLPGRFEVLSTRPVFIVDGSHNPQGVSTLVETLDELYPEQKLTFIMGVLADKDYATEIDMLVPKAETVVCVTPPNPRALEASDLATRINEAAGAQVACVAGSFETAIVKARELAGADGPVIAFGSLYSVSSVKKAFKAVR